VPPPGRKANLLTSSAKTGTFGRSGQFLLCATVCAGIFLARPAHGDNPAADAIGAIEGEAISVEGPMSVDVVHGQVRTILRSGSDVHVKAGQARVDLVEGGYILICGPAHFSVLKKGGAITLALDSGTIHAQIGSEVSLDVYTAQIQAHPISIGNGIEDLLVGVAGSGAMCIRANRGAIRVEQQLTGQSVIVPQSGDITLTNGQIDSLRTTTGQCSCEMQTNLQPMTPATEISQPASPDEIKRRALEPKKSVQPTSVAQTAQPEEPVYQIFMPPLQYDAKAKVQADYDPNLVILVRRVRVRPTLIYQGRVEGDPVEARANPVTPVAKPQVAPQKPAEESTWNRVKTYILHIWSPAT
jgi:hypothetical protein